MITPVFALDAEDLFETGQYTDAVALCRQGLELYPEYASGYVVLYRALIALERDAEALTALKSGLEALPANRILLRLINEHSIAYTPKVEEEAIEFPAIVIENRPAETVNEVLLADFDTITELSADETESETDFTDAIADIEPVSEEIEEVLINDAELEEFIPATKPANLSYSDDEPKTDRPIIPALRIIESASQGEKVLIRASSIGLIPGLQFTPMSLRRPARRFSSELPELPLFREFEKQTIVIPGLQDSEIKTKTPLEELAARLEKARVAIVQEETPAVQESTVEIVSTATETVAKIYESQGAFSQAVKVYKQLAQSKPELREKYEIAIERLRNKPDAKKTR